MFNPKKHILTLVGIGVGMLGGFLYWKYVGCLSGTCPITSNPTNSTIYGGLMGGLLLSMFKKEIK
jgi:hypothetical protein